MACGYGFFLVSCSTFNLKKKNYHNRIVSSGMGARLKLIALPFSRCCELFGLHLSLWDFAWRPKLLREKVSGQRDHTLCLYRLSLQNRFLIHFMHCVLSFVFIQAEKSISFFSLCCCALFLFLAFVCFVCCFLCSMFLFNHTVNSLLTRINCNRIIYMYVFKSSTQFEWAL